MTWVRRGVVACHVAEEQGWTLVTSADGRTAAAEPYDDPTTVLLARPVGPRSAPSIGVGVVGDRAVVVTQASGWRTIRRWTVRPRTGPVARTSLPHLRPGDLTPFAPGVASREVTDLLEERTLPAHEWLATLLETLRLPGADVVRGEHPPGPVVEPDARSLTAFARVVEDGRP